MNDLEIVSKEDQGNMLWNFRRNEVILLYLSSFEDVFKVKLWV